MHRNTIIAICAGFCAVAVIAGLFVANLSSANRTVIVAQSTPSAEKPTAAPTSNGVAQAPTSAPPTAATTSAPPAAATTSAPSAVPTAEPTNAPAATAVPTIAPTSVPTATPALAGEFIEYTVQRGDELLQLAKKYNVSAKEIMANNEIPNPDSLVVGQVLRIPKK